MFKFVHKKHINKELSTNRIVIYYNLFDIILGFTLIVLVGIFIYNYLDSKIFKPVTGSSVYPVVVSPSIHASSTPKQIKPTTKLK